MDKSPAPSLLPIFRSRQQAEILALVLGSPGRDFTLPEIAEMAGAPYSSVHREIDRCESAGLISTRRIGRSRVIAADTNSPYFDGLAEVLVRAFGPPRVLAEELEAIDGVDEAYIFGSWAARHSGWEQGGRPVKDVDVLILGRPDRDELYAAVSRAEARLGREVQVVIRESGWLEDGADSFHDTVVGRPLVALALPVTRRVQADSSP